MWLHEEADGTRYVVLPRGTFSGDWSATEIETRLMDALAALSAQGDVDQQQRAEAQDMLSTQVDDLAQLVQDFAAQHEKQAGALQAQLQ